MNSYAETMMIQMLNRRFSKQRCIECEILEEERIEKKKRQANKKGKHEE